MSTIGTVETTKNMEVEDVDEHKQGGNVTLGLAQQAT